MDIFDQLRADGFDFSDPSPDSSPNTENVIWKYEIKAANTDISIPPTAEVLTAGYDQGRLYVWVLLDPDAPRVTRRLILTGTGVRFKNKFVKHIATFRGGEYVSHLLEVEP